MRMIALGLILVFCQIPMTAYAQSARDQAKTLFKKGNKDFSAKRYSDALAAFKQANTLSPHPVMHKNIANVYRAMYDYARAIESYRRYLRSKPRDARNIRSRIGKMQAERAGWPSLKLATTPPGVAVRVANELGSTWGRTPFTLRLPPGRHILHLSKRGFESLTRPLLFEAKTNRSMNFTLVARTVAASPVPAVVAPVAPMVSAPVATPGPALVAKKPLPVQSVPVTTPVRPEASSRQSSSLPPDERGPAAADTTPPPATAQPTIQSNAEPEIGGFDRRKWSWIGMGTGAALLVGGAGLAFVAMGTSGDLDTCRENSACVRTDREVTIAGDVRAQAMLADGLIAVGAVTAGVGVALYLMSRDDQTAKTAVMLVPTPGGATATGLFRF